ncbi:MAG: signal peptidase II [Oscillospiraceae bacterium]|nr:signal peptidase II [Oscillospiraceae bacterium]
MIIFLVILGIILVVIDQLIKIWASNVLKPVKVMDFIHFGKLDIMDLHYVQNEGAAFSSFSGARWFLVGLVIVMLIGLTVFVVKYKYKCPFFLISAVMVMAGGIGNLIDRVRFGYVIDYLDVKLFNFAVFNFADICVVLGAIFLLIFLFWIEPKIVEKEKAEEEKEMPDEQI